MVDNLLQLPYCRVQALKLWDSWGKSGKFIVYCMQSFWVLNSNFKHHCIICKTTQEIFNCLIILTTLLKLPAVSFPWLMNLSEQTENQQSADYCRQIALWFKSVGQKYYQSRQTSLWFNCTANKFSICHPRAWSPINTNIWERYTWEWPWIWWSQHKTVFQTNTTHFIELTHLTMGDGSEGDSLKWRVSITH